MARSFQRKSGVIAFSVFLTVALVLGVTAGVLTKTYLRTDRVERHGDEAITRVGESFSLLENLTPEQRNYDWIKAQDYDVSVFAYDSRYSIYVPVEGLARYGGDHETVRISGVGKGMVRLSNSVFSDVRVDIPFESRFSSGDTEKALKASGYRIFDDGFALEDELSSVTHLDLDGSFERADFSDYGYFENLTAVNLTSAETLLPLSLEHLPEQAHVYVPTANFLSYDSSAYWASRRHSVFPLKNDPKNASVVLLKNGGRFAFEEEVSPFAALEVAVGSTLDLEGRYALHRDGARFLGWNEALCDEGFSDGDPVRGDLRLSAAFEDITYRLYFHYDNATALCPEDKTLVTCRYGETPLTPGVNDKTHEDFALIGWSLDKTSDEPTFGLQQELPADFLDPSQEEYHFYAFWVYKEAEVVIKAEQGEQSLGPVRYNGAKAIQCLETPIGDGRFKGYSRDVKATRVEYRDGDVATDLYVRDVVGDPRIFLYPVFAPEYFSMGFIAEGHVLPGLEGLSDYRPVELPRVGRYGLFDADLTRHGHRFVGWKDIDSGALYVQEDVSSRFAESEVYVDAELTFSRFGGEGLSHIDFTAVFVPNAFSVSFASTPDPDERVYEPSTFDYGALGYLTGTLSKKGHTLSRIVSPAGVDVKPGIDGATGEMNAATVNALYDEILAAEGCADNAFPKGAGILLTPEWKRDVYSVSFDLNGHGAGVVVPVTQEVAYGDYASEPFSPQKGVVYGGYTFGGWTLEGTPFDFASTPIEGSITLKAVWYANLIPVTFVLNPLEQYPCLSVDNAEAFHERKVYTEEHPTLDEDPVATGYDFAGWYLDPSFAPERKVNDVSEVSVIAPVAFYAKWVAKTYEVTYHAQGHGDVPLDEFTHTLTYPDRADLVLETREDEPDYVFRGWAKDPAGSEPYDSSLPVTEDLELYAVWERMTLYVDVHYLLGPEDKEAHVSAIHYGDEVAMPEVGDPYGYTFAGFVDRDGNPVEFPFVMGLSNQYWYATWEKVTFQVTFDFLDGREEYVREVSYLDYVPSPDTSLETRQFEGWYRDKDFTSRFDVASEAIVADITLYAHWTVQATFDDNANDRQAKRSTVTVDYGAALPKPGSPSEHGYVFDGWYLGQERVNFSTYVFTENVTLTARWHIASFYVTYDFNGGSGQDLSGYYPYKSLLPKPTDPSNGNKTFDGWFIGDDKWEFDKRLVGSDLTLVAHWSGCVVYGTEVSMADGSVKNVEDVLPGDLVLTFDHMSGRFIVGTIILNELSMGEEESTVVTLVFDDGTSIGVVGEHGFFDVTLGTYAFLNADNAASYVGHRFAGVGESKRLVSVSVTCRSVGYASPIVAGTFDFVSNGLISVSDMLEPFVFAFDYDADMRIDQARLSEDLALYGLMEYEAVAGSFPEEVFVAFHGKLLLLIEGKGLASVEDIVALYRKYADWFV